MLQTIANWWIRSRHIRKGPVLDLSGCLMRIEELEAENAVLRSLLKECLGDYGHPMFTDRHGMADRIREALNHE